MAKTERVEGRTYSNYLGVDWYRRGQIWIAHCRNKGKLVHIGYFKDELEAAKAYDRYVIENNLKRRLNFPTEQEPPLPKPKTRWIRLSQGKFALVDEKHYEWLNKYRWFILACGDIEYAVTNIKGADGKYVRVLMHRLILGITDKKMEIDHKDHNGLNNTEENIRSCTKSQNLTNMKKRINTNGKFKGTTYIKETDSYRGRLGVKGKGYNLGKSKSEIVLARRYNMAGRWFNGEWAYLND